MQISCTQHLVLTLSIVSIYQRTKPTSHRHGQRTHHPQRRYLPRFKGGLKQLDTLRSIGAQLQPLGLTTGYGDVLGNWCLKNIEEGQSAFLQGGIPRKQGFTLEFVRYGDDLQNR